MKKEIHPGILVAAVVVVIAIAGFIFYRASAAPEAQAMGPQGPGAAMLKKAGGDMTKSMTPEEQAMMQKSLGGRKANTGPAR
ncbi:MAG TPA: hypothetical protein VKU00_03740 [Chthonomonadaceae bacterium]|nr:hypothetical protein [Chthonomonadaceae bacterium]